MSGAPLILKAAFELDAAGKPAFVERDGIRHYWIRLSVENAPAEAVSVTYRLHDSYWDPVREVPRSSAADFGERISSFGDFVVQASLSGTTRPLRAAPTELSQLLGHGYPEPRDRAFEEAISDISTH
jgi:hypothetical protein